MIVSMGTELAYAMCIGCPVSEEVRDTTCYKNKGRDAMYKGNTCYLDEIKKGNIVWSHDSVKTLFGLADDSEDYCVDKQDGKVVFGGRNRVYLYPDGSIKVSERHCNSTFLRVSKQLGIEIV